MEFNFKFFNENKIKDRVKSYVMGIDVGGTNTNIGIAGIMNSKPYLLYSLNFDSKQLKSVIPAIKETLNYSIETFDILPEIACIGAAGVVSADSKYAELTNLEWNVDSNVIIKETNLKSLHIINDFQSIGYGINLLDEKNENDIINLKPELENDKYSSFTKVIIGAGTGLGKSILRYDDSFRAHIPIPSEGGHTDFPVHNNFDMELVNFIKKFRGISKLLYYLQQNFQLYHMLLLLFYVYVQ